MLYYGERAIQMHIVYWAHSYRDEDAPINRYFGVLIENGAKMVVNFDPPSESVNSSKLERNLLASNGMVAVLPWRATGASQYILYEIGLALRARKPLVVFVDDRLPDNIIPARILQRRYSPRTYFRQIRAHTHALQIFKEYMGPPPPAPYQPSTGQRSCGLLGLDDFSDEQIEQLRALAKDRGYRPVDLRTVEIANPLIFDSYEYLASLDIVLACADAPDAKTRFWAGALGAAAVPAITFTASPVFEFNDEFPIEFQPRKVDSSSVDNLGAVLGKEFGLCEQDFLAASDEKAIERYTQTLVEAGSLDGRYEASTRNSFVEVIMGDQYNSFGQAGAMGRFASAQNMTFQQTWEQVGAQLDLSILADELAKLHGEMDKQAVEPMEKLSVGAVAAAQESARLEDGPKVMEYLKLAGKWALSIAEKIGVDVAKEALKGSLGV